MSRCGVNSDCVVIEMSATSSGVRPDRSCAGHARRRLDEIVVCLLDHVRAMRNLDFATTDAAFADRVDLNDARLASSLNSLRVRL
jgi:hypothetical protein